MAANVKKVDVWVTDLANHPGTLARVLEALAQAGADLEFLIARQVDENTSRLFLAPLKGKKQQRAAAEVGLVPAQGMHSIRLEGLNRPGVGAELTRAISVAGLNIRGASAAAMGRQHVFYLAFNTEDDAKAATKVVRKVLAGTKKKR